MLQECLCLFVENDQRDSSEPIRFVMTVVFLGDSMKRFVCYFHGVSNVEDPFQLFSIICVKPLFLCPCYAVIE